MKFIIYYFFYLTNNIEANISTVIRVYDTKIEFYVYEVGYIKWDIIDKEESIDSKGVCLLATYHLQYEDIKALVKINCEQAIIIIFVEEEVEHITLRKKR